MNELADFLDDWVERNRGFSLRRMYETLQGYRELAGQFGIDDVEADKRIVKWKKRIRTKIKKDREEWEERKCVRNLGDTCVYLIRLGEFKNLFEADDYFMWNEYHEYIPSAYDCTGQLFTNWYYIFKRHGIYYAYHSVSLDV